MCDMDTESLSPLDEDELLEETSSFREFLEEVEEVVLPPIVGTVPPQISLVEDVTGGSVATRPKTSPVALSWEAAESVASSHHTTSSHRSHRSHKSDRHKSSRKSTHHHRSRSTERRHGSSRRRSRSASPRRHNTSSHKKTSSPAVITTAALSAALVATSTVVSETVAAQTLSSVPPVRVVDSVTTADPRPLAVLPEAKVQSAVVKSPPVTRVIRITPVTSAPPVQTSVVAVQSAQPPNAPTQITKVAALPQAALPPAAQFRTAQTRAHSPTPSEISVTTQMKEMEVVARERVLPMEQDPAGTDVFTTSAGLPTPAGLPTQPTEQQITSGQMPHTPTDGSVADSADTDVSGTAMQQPQKFHGQELPFRTRNMGFVQRLLVAWMAMLYSCPYPDCTYKSTRGIPASMHTTPATETFTLRPDRYCDFLEHWWCNHMYQTLKFRCMYTGCKLVGRIFKSMTNFTKHLQGHYPRSRRNDIRVTGPANLCLQEFCDSAGDDPDPKQVAKGVIYPPNHINLKQYVKIQEEERRQNKVRKVVKAKDTARALARAVDQPRVPAQTETTTTRDLKRPTSTVTSTANPPKMSRVGPLVEGFLKTGLTKDRCCAEDVAAIHVAFGRINFVYGYGIKEQLDIAKEKMDEVHYNRMAVWKELDNVRVALMRFRDDIDIGGRTLSTWQSSLSKDPQTHCAKVLVHASVMCDAQRLVDVEAQLQVSNDTNVRLGGELHAALDRIAVLEAERVAAPIGAGEHSRALPPVALGAPRRQLSIPIFSDQGVSIQSALASLYALVGTATDQAQTD